MIAEWVTRRRNDERTATGAARPRKVPSARAIARMMTTERGLLSKTVTRTMAIIESAIPALVVARDLMDRFHSMIKRHAGADLDAYTKRPNDRLFAHPRHAGESRYPRPAFVGAKKDVDTGLRRHDGGAAPMGQSLGPLVLVQRHIRSIVRYPALSYSPMKLTFIP